MVSLRASVVFIVMMLASLQASATDGWTSYKNRFMTSEGRIVDTGNNNVSHTEGQGYAMLMAVWYNDRSSFTTLWQWTQQHLSNPQNGLFYWKYNPAAADPVADKNNASDGDVLIAWALFKAGQKWRNPAWLQASDRIQRAIVDHNVTSFGGYTVMLPASHGFNKTSYLVINPSYFLFSAWRDFASRNHLKVWNNLIDSGMDLLSKMRFGDASLPVDWVALNADGSVAPATAWPPRFGYDAIRVPLYVYWYDPQSLQLVPFQRYWMGFSRLQTPAWIDVMNNNKASYTMSGGLLAVRDLTLNSGNLSDQLNDKEDYYSASLQMLAWMAMKDR